MFQDGHLATNGTNGYHGENNIAVEASIGMANEVDYQKVAKEIREMDDRLNR